VLWTQCQGDKRDVISTMNSVKIDVLGAGDHSINGRFFGRGVILLYLTVLLLLLSTVVFAQGSNSQAFSLSPDLESANISSMVSVYETRDVVSDPNVAFELWQRGDFQSGIFDQSVSTELVDGSSWLAFRLTSEQAGQNKWVLSTRDVMHLTRLTLYVPVIDRGNKTYRLQEDSLHSLTSPPRGTSFSSFLLDSSFDSSRPFLIKVAGQLPLSAPLLVQGQQVAQWESAVRIAITSLLIGAVLGLVLYNFILYFFVRDITYLLYVAYAGAMLLWLAQISGYMLFLDRSFGLAYYHSVTPNLSAGVANLFGSIFTVVFLRLYHQNRSQGIVVIAVALFNVAIGVLSYFLVEDPRYQLIHKLQHGVAMLSALVIVVPTIILVLKGYRFALPFVLAWGALGTGIILLGAGVQYEFFGVPFPVGFNVLAAMVVEMVMMSYALGLRIKDVQLEADQMAHLSITDGLTGLFNQRHFHQRASELMSDSSVGSQAPWACAMIDIDHFKRFNDSYGHLLGDKVLKRLSQIIRSNIRQQDLAFRVGGEEFALLLKTETLAEALKIVERIRTHFEESKITSDSGELIRCSLSAGVTLLQPQDSAEHFIDRADQALYSAKSAGRNCVLVGA
jgi:diguanylate cyclase (GGDEF)-like protein